VVGVLVSKGVVVSGVLLRLLLFLTHKPLVLSFALHPCFTL
jgi:hypothetical protein